MGSSGCILTRLLLEATGLLVVCAILVIIAGLLVVCAVLTIGLLLLLLLGVAIGLLLAVLGIGVATVLLVLLSGHEGRSSRSEGSGTRLEARCTRREGGHLALWATLVQVNTLGLSREFVLP